MLYVYMKRKDVGETLGAEDYQRFGESTQEKLDETIKHYSENGFEMSTVEEYVAAGNAQPDDTDESPNEGDAADVTNAEIPEEGPSDDEAEEVDEKTEEAK